jgi:hypothetical protein
MRPTSWPWTAFTFVSLAFATAPSVVGCGNEAEIGTKDAALGDETETSPSDSDETELSETTATSSEPSLADAATTSQPVCEAASFPSEATPVLFERLEAQVVDSSGNPLADVLAQACGLNLCLSGRTEASGDILHTRPSTPQPTLLSKAAFKYGDGIRQAQFARLLEEGSVHSLGTQTTAVFPALASGSPLAAGQTLSSGGVELELTTQTQIKVDVLTVKKDEEIFLAVEFPTDAFPEALDDSLEIELLFALGPLKTHFCPPAQLRLPNRLGWPAGQVAEIFIHGTDVLEELVPFGEWRKVSDAEVSADGEWIETTEDQGLPVLAAIGVRRAP